jgi:RHS repeat-associated protein
MTNWENIYKSQGVTQSYLVTNLVSNSWITDASGAVNQHLQYLPLRQAQGSAFGEDFIYQRNSSWAVPYTFSGKEKDSETGYSYFGARYYDSDLSVWLSVDPLSDMYHSTSPYMYVRGNPVLLVDPNGMSDEPFGIGTRFSNWIKGDGWKNKANKFIAKNNLTSKTNSDGSISAHDAESWQRLNETGAESGLNTLDYTFTEDGYSLTTNSSATHNETTQSFSYKSSNNSILNSNNTLGLLGTLNLIGDAAKQALRSTANFLKTTAELGADKVLKNVTRFAKGTGFVAGVANTFVNGYQVYKNWNSPNRNYYIAKGLTSLAIAGVNAIPVVGTVASVVLSGVEASGGFDGLYQKF